MTCLAFRLTVDTVRQKETTMAIRTTRVDRPARPVDAQMPTGVARLLGAFGIPAVVVFAAGHLAHGSIPAGGASASVVSAYYRAHHARVSFAAILIGAGALLFLGFASAVRARLRSTGAEAFATWGFGGGIAFATGITVSAAFLAALGGGATHITPSALQAIHVLLFYGFPVAGVGAASFLVPNGIAVVRSRALPAWLGWVAIPFGVLGLAPEPAGDIAILGLAVWTMIVSVLLVRERTSD